MPQKLTATACFVQEESLGGMHALSICHRALFCISKTVLEI